MSHFKFVVLLTHPKLAMLALPLSTCSYSLYTISGLKGQVILAPGNAWGKRNKEEPVRANALIKVKTFFGRNWDSFLFVRNEDNPSIDLFSRTIFMSVSQTQGASRFYRDCPGLDYAGLSGCFCFRC